MRTEDIIKALKLTSQLMELHDENPFKVKALANAVFRLDKSGLEVSGKPVDELSALEGIGKSVAQKIDELNKTGNLRDLQELMDKTPAGVIEMLKVKGIGPKKVGLLWRQLGIESVGELLYACRENRLVELKGFGAKTQDQVRRYIEFAISNSGKHYYAAVEGTADELVRFLKNHATGGLVSLTGNIRRKDQIIETVDALVAADHQPDLSGFLNTSGVKISVKNCQPADFYRELFLSSASSAHFEKLGNIELPEKHWNSEEEIYSHLGLPYIEPELREGLFEIDLAKAGKLPRLITIQDLKGILHNHTTYSDGLHTVREMAEHCRDLGYSYLGICDHSQSAFYAGGLKPEEIIKQHSEIDALNKELAPFRIFKGIESDILSDGSLDYPEEILKTFDFIVASIHSNLKMNEEKAMSRLIRAIENPYTNILGHPTGRLLLSREGYPIDHKKVIDACAANDVIIELNSHPYRLDIDWRWIPYCLEKGVMISINPDAHEKEGYHDMHYGVCVARKGMLTAEMCFNARTKEFVEETFIKKRVKV